MVVTKGWRQGKRGNCYLKRIELQFARGKSLEIYLALSILNTTELYT